MTLFTKFLHCHGRRFAIPLTTSAMCPLSAITERPGGSLARPAVPVRHVERPRIRPVYDLLRGRAREVSWGDFEAASRLAVEDVKSGPNSPDR
jgi:hypothetical protein